MPHTVQTSVPGAVRQPEHIGPSEVRTAISRWFPQPMHSAEDSGSWFVQAWQSLSPLGRRSSKWAVLPHPSQTARCAAL